MSKPIFLYLVTPKNIQAKDIIDFWSAKAKLTEQGYNVVVYEDDKKPRVRKKENHNMVIIAKKQWEQDKAITKATKWASKRGLNIKIIHPNSWKDISNYKNTKEKLKSILV